MRQKFPSPLRPAGAHNASQWRAETSQVRLLRKRLHLAQHPSQTRSTAPGPSSLRVSRLRQRVRPGRDAAHAPVASAQDAALRVRRLPPAVQDQEPP